jgi:UV DNA damage endonuclease
MEFNAKNHLLFLRISSDLVPFASHPANTFDWQTRFRGDFEELGRFVDKAGMRISMHPDQFTLINSVSSEIFQRSRRELLYHVQVLDLMNLDASAKVQIHVGGAYGDKPASMERFARRFTKLDETIRRRLVVENDDRLFNVDDCLRVSAQTGVPVLFDVFHHKYNNLGEALPMAAVAKTWNEKSDGIPMMDYSSQNPNGAPRMHARTLDENDFRLFLEQTAPWDFDVMLEI